MFNVPLDLRQLSGGRWWLLTELRYTSKVLGGVIVVPREFITDLASVPRAPFAYMLTGDRARGPAVVHDFLYQHVDFTDRALCDAVFNEAMAVDQSALGYDAESVWIRGIMYAGVRAGGWKAWADHGKRREDLNPIWSATQWPDPVVQS